MRVRLTEERYPRMVRRIASFDDTAIWWEMEGPTEALPLPLERHDLAATALIFQAMRTRRDLHIEGPVSRSLLAELEEFVVCWALWRPDLYSQIRLSADVELEAPGPVRHPKMAIAACSGGVDSSFTIWRHVTRQASRNTRELGAALFVHGLDIPLANEQQYEDAFAAASDTMASINVPLVKMRTNWREAASRVWAMEFGAGLSTCLRHWQGSFGSALIGSGEDYAHLGLPWGSNPITFAMLSTPDFQIILDGSGFGRTAKVQLIGEWPECLANLRVCWQNASSSANCGRCEKCVRTKLNLKAVGLKIPPSLGGEPTIGKILTLRARNAMQIFQLQDILNFSNRNGGIAPWKRAVQFAIAWNYVLNSVKGLKKRLFGSRWSKRLAAERGSSSPISSQYPAESGANKLHDLALGTGGSARQEP